MMIHARIKFRHTQDEKNIKDNSIIQDSFLKLPVILALKEPTVFSKAHWSHTHIGWISTNFFQNVKPIFMQQELKEVLLWFFNKCSIGLTEMD